MKNPALIFKVQTMADAVAAVGFKHDGIVEICDGPDEATIVAGTLSKIETALDLNREVVGFNCLSFDMPFLVRRAWKHGVKVPWTLGRGRYWHQSIVDLRERWLMGERQPAKGTSSLDSIAAFLGLPPKLGRGEDYATMTLEQRREYLTRDLDITEAVYLRMVGQ